MAVSTAHPSTRPLRAGGTALALLGSPFNVGALRALAAGPLPLRELLRVLGFPPRSTARLYLRTLSEVGALERRARSEFPASVDYGIAEAGLSLLEVADALQAWLDGSPFGSTQLDSIGAHGAVKALVDGWSSKIVRAVATRPLSLTEFDNLIPRISYPSLERRLTAMRDAGLIEADRHPGRASPYRATDWLRRSVRPLLAGADWERRYLAQRTADLRRLDVEAALLLAVPSVELARDLSGSCRLAVEAQDSSDPRGAGVLVAVDRGAVTSFGPSSGGETDAWAYGTAGDWLDELEGRARSGLKLGGKTPLARALVRALGRTVTETT